MVTGTIDKQSAIEAGDKAQAEKVNLVSVRWTYTTRGRRMCVGLCLVGGVVVEFVTASLAELLFMLADLEVKDV